MAENVNKEEMPAEVAVAEETVPETPAAENTETEAPKTQKEIFMANIRSKHPEMEDDEAVYGYANDKYQRMKDANTDASNVMKILTEHPEMIDAMEAFTKFGSKDRAIKALASEEELRNIADSYNEPIDDEAEAKLMEEYKGRREGSKKAVARAEEVANKFAEDNGIDKEEVRKFLAELVDKLNSGEIESILTDNMHSRNREKDMKAEYERGLTEGRNAKIAETKKEKKTDGLPAAATAAPKAEKKNDGNPFAFLRNR